MLKSEQYSVLSKIFEYVPIVILYAVHCVLIHTLYSYVPEPYMDEIFHINQTRRYCIGDYSWNEKITTPPALYVFAMSTFCGYERWTNIVIWPMAFIGAIRFRRLFTHSSLIVTAILVLHLPVLYQTSLLFYTDLFSLTTLLWAFSFNDSPLIATAFFTVAVLTRQTNIIWAAIYGLYHLLRQIDHIRNSSSSSSSSTTIYMLLIVLRSMLYLLPLLLLGVGFMLFFVLNDFSIVLGDRSAHIPVVHCMQLYYSFMFICFTAAPYLLFSSHLFYALRDIFQSYKHLFKTLLSCCCIALCVRAFTMEHPYLLADNRHFTFYIWRRYFRRHPTCKYILVPFYLIAAKAIARSVRHIPRLLILLYVMASIVTLIPSQLLEPRYFIIPYVLWRLSLGEKRLWLIGLEITYQFCINALVLYLFFAKPFEWLNEPGIKQRFMW